MHFLQNIYDVGSGKTAAGDFVLKGKEHMLKESVTTMERRQPWNDDNNGTTAMNDNHGTRTTMERLQEWNDDNNGMTTTMKR